MGYSRSIKTLEKRLPLLLNLTRGNETEWKCSAGFERTLAYQIREALFIAENFASKEYPKLARAASEFEISEVSPGHVIARRRQKPRVGEITSNVVVAPITSAAGIIEYFDPEGIDNKHFPSASLNQEEASKLSYWLREEHNWLLFWNEENGSVTLKPFDEELVELAFDEEEDHEE